MSFEFSNKVKDLAKRTEAFMDEHIYPNEKTYHDQVDENGWDRAPPIIEELKEKARAQGLWNMFLPDSDLGYGLSNLEYAPLCEIMGRSKMAAEAFNCSRKLHVARLTTNSPVSCALAIESFKPPWGDGWSPRTSPAAGGRRLL